MQTKFKLQTILLSAMSFFILLLIIDIAFIQKEARQQNALEKKQRIIIPFKEIKDKINHE